MFGSKKVDERADDPAFQGCLKAEFYYKNPEKLDAIKSAYAIVYESDIGGKPDRNYLSVVMNTMAAKGWRCVNLATMPTGGLVTVYALMEKVNNNVVR